MLGNLRNDKAEAVRLFNIIEEIKDNKDLEAFVGEVYDIENVKKDLTYVMWHLKGKIGDLEINILRLEKGEKHE